MPSPEPHVSPNTNNTPHPLQSDASIMVNKILCTETTVGCNFIVSYNDQHYLGVVKSVDAEKN